MSSEENKVENPVLLVFMVLLFCLSVGLIIYGVLKNRNQTTPTTSGKASDVGITNNGNGDSLSKYFENNQNSSIDSGKDDYYLQTDPFKDTCSEAGSEKTPFVISGTVCYR